MTAQEARALMPEQKDPFDELMGYIFEKIKDKAIRNGNSIEYYYGPSLKEFEQRILLIKLDALGYGVTNFPDMCLIQINW